MPDTDPKPEAVQLDEHTKTLIRAVQLRIAEIDHYAEKLPEHHRMLAATHLHAASVLLGWPDPVGGPLESASLAERLYWRRQAREQHAYVAHRFGGDT